MFQSQIEVPAGFFQCCERIQFAGVKSGSSGPGSCDLDLIDTLLLELAQELDCGTILLLDHKTRTMKKHS
jgi:hypothetical protein